MTNNLAIILFTVLICQSSSFSIPRPLIGPYQLTQKCIDVLPYKPIDINREYYYTWFGKLGENINGTTYENGHVFTRHIAVNYKCTDEQKKDNKTVFYDESQFYKALNRDTTNCTMTSDKEFNFSQNHVIAAPNDYIKGIDCITGVVHTFSSYFVEYKRAIQNAKPTQAQCMASKYVTVWTFYPKR